MALVVKGKVNINEFIVDEKRYVAILEVEYNRHDKTYYFVDGSDFRVEEL